MSFHCGTLGGGGVYLGTFLLMGLYSTFTVLYVESIEPTWEFGNMFVFFKKLSYAQQN